MIKKIILFVFILSSLQQFAQKKNELEYDPNNPAPVIMVESLMTGILFSSNNGGANIQYAGINALFLPIKDKKGNTVNYDVSYPKEARIFMTIKKDGKPFFRKLAASANGNDVQKIISFAIESRELIKNPPPPYTEGNYLLEFFVDDKKFYEFPFSITKVNVKDVYSDIKEVYFLHGMWDDWAILHKTEDGALRWSMYLQTETIETGKDIDNSVDLFHKVEVFKDGKLYAKGSRENTVRVSRERKEAVRMIVYPEAKRGMEKVDLSGDGKYEIKVEINETHFSYNFEVKNGKIQLDPRQDRSKNPDPFTLIEGKDYKFFMKNSTGNSTTLNIKNKK